MAYNPVNPNGQTTSANSSPVVIASDQSAVAVGGSSLTSLATNQTNGTQQTQLIPSSTQPGLLVNFQASLSSTVTNIKTSAGSLYGYNFFNPGTALTYVQLFNVAAASVTLGTTTPIMSIALPSNANASIGDDLMYPIPIKFSSAISYAATTLPTGSIAPSVPLVTNVYYI